MRILQTLQILLRRNSRWCAAYCAFALNLFVAELHAQPIDTALYGSRHRAIEENIKAENYGEARDLVTKQVNYLEQIGAYDSLYRYTYYTGRSWWKTEDADTAIARIEALWKIIETHDSDTAHLLKSMNDLSWIYYETGNADQCRQIDLEYLAMAEAFSGIMPNELSIAHYNIGFNYLDVGNSIKAVEHFRRSIEVLPDDSQEYTGRLVNGYNALGAAIYRTGNLREAKKAFEDCLVYITRMQDDFSHLGNRSNAYGNLSLIAQDEGLMVQATDYLQQAIAERKRAIESGGPAYELEQHHKLLLSNYRNLAALYLGLGDSRKALRLVEQLHEMQKEILEPGDSRFNLTLDSFGSIYLAMGQYQKALEHIKQYKVYCERDYGRESFHTGAAYKRLGEIYLQSDELEKSLESFDHAVEIFTIISEDGSGQDLANTLIRRAEVFKKLATYSNAEKDIAQAIAIFRNTRGEFDPSLGQAYSALALLHLENNQVQQANASIDQALVALEGYGEKLTKSGLHQLNNPVLHLPEAYYVKAQIVHAVNSGKNGKETDHYLNKAIDLLRKTRSTFDGEDAMLSLYTAHAGVFDFAMNLCYAQFQATEEQQYLERMFELAEESKTILLRRQLNFFSSVQYHNIPDSLVTLERELVAVLTGKTDEQTEHQDYFKIEQQYQQLLQTIRAEYPEYYALRFQEKSTTIAEIQEKLLASDETLLKYLATDNQLYALIIHPDTAHLIQLEAAGAAELISRYNYTIAQLEVEPFAQIASGLYRILIEPLEPLLKHRNLYIVPSEQLFSINFETLVKPGVKTIPQYLIYDYNISYLLSATTALQYNELRHKANGGILAVAPGFSDEVKAAYRRENSSLLLDEHYLHSVQQPFAERTAQHVTGFFTGKALIGMEATESRFKEKAGQYGIIHMGTHTEINNSRPMLSRLILNKEWSTPPQNEDGYLHAYEIYNLPLRAELAVLTACETGVGQINKIEGVLSLAHSFAYAGCPSIVMSLWQIDEKTSAGIIEDFYRNLATGKSKNAALRDAKLKYLKDARGEMAAPYFWAGLVLAGNTSPIQNQRTDMPWWQVIALFAAMGLIALMVIRRRNTR